MVYKPGTLYNWPLLCQVVPPGKAGVESFHDLVLPCYCGQCNTEYEGEICLPLICIQRHSRRMMVGVRWWVRRRPSTAEYQSDARLTAASDATCW